LLKAAAAVAAPLIWELLAEAVLLEPTLVTAEVTVALEVHLLPHQ
jgi:hypothetical protein